ncbi:unnamed protein product [Durusdinium trenchii]|uniref:Uncharacterized protein n=1 Tax=Durusdinium trenchii TaxID=1381693 RepID=A0ABP0LP02_9DINO
MAKLQGFGWEDWARFGMGDVHPTLMQNMLGNGFSTPVFLACFVSALTHCDAWQPRFCAPALRRLERLNLPRPVSGTSDEVKLRDWVTQVYSLRHGAPEGEMIGLRLPPGVDLKNVDSEYGLYMFDDGGQKALAAALVLLGCLHLAGTEPIESLRHPHVTGLVKGLLQIPTLHKSQASDEVSQMLQRIVKQNVDAKKLPVSSFEWCGILERLGEESIGSISEAVQKYNEANDRSASGSLMIDSKKCYAIGHWMHKCCKEAKAIVMDAMQDAPFQYGPFGEGLAQMPQLFIGSKADGMRSSPESGLFPLANEETLRIDWDLTLESHGQAMLFERIKRAFEMNTAIVAEVRDKRKYRMSLEDLTSVRNLCALWQQIRAFCMTRIPDEFTKLDERLRSGSSMDEQLQPLFQECPSVFSISMLPLTQKAALTELKLKEESVTVEVERQRLELRAAKWKWFQGALARDQSQMALISQAPEKIQALKHRKVMSWRLEQAKVGERVVLAYADKFLRCRQVEKLQHLHEVLHEYRSFVAESAGIKQTDLCMVSFCDLNVPLANSKERMGELMQAIACINDIQPSKNIGIVECAEHPRKSSRRGHADEEKELQEELWALRQQCDTRWILPFEVPASAEAHSSRRRWSFGRLVTNKEAEETNQFMVASELALAGRPLTDKKIVIPLSKDLLLPESLEADEDLKQADRQRPSAEAIAAQKGSDRYLALFRSLFSLSGDGLAKQAVILINLTGYVEELGAAAFRQNLALCSKAIPLCLQWICHGLLIR